MVTITDKMHISNATRIQKYAIPQILSQKDVYVLFLELMSDFP